MKQVLTIVGVMGLVALVAGCSKNEPVSNPVPVIQARSVTKFSRQAGTTAAKRDSVVVTINYTDGDGDLNESLKDTVRLKQVFGSQSWGNYEIRTFKLVNGTFTEIITAANAKHIIDLGGRSGTSVSGTIDYSQEFAYAGTYQLLPVKFRIRIRDHALNESNVVETDTIRIPVPD